MNLNSVWKSQSAPFISTICLKVEVYNSSSLRTRNPSTSLIGLFSPVESSYYLLFTWQVVAMTSLHHQSSALFVPTIKVLNLKAIFKSLWLGSRRFWSCSSDLVTDQGWRPLTTYDKGGFWLDWCENVCLELISFLSKITVGCWKSVTAVGQLTQPRFC